MRPSGKLHIGHLYGVLDNWVILQEEYQCFFEIADWHALTTKFDSTGTLENDIWEMVIDWLSVGVDPKKAVIFVQSEVPEHAELHLLLSMLMPLARLELVPTFKEQVRELHLDNTHTTYGLLGYPVLQAADILLYKGELVPIGQDQLSHLELTRELARKFNNLYGEVMIEPKERFTPTPKLLGLDGRKMSKSYGNAIFLSDSPDEIVKKTKEMITDPARIKRSDVGHPEVCNVYAYHQLFQTENIEEIYTNCTQALMGCVDCKKMLAQRIVEHMAPIHQKRKELEAQPEVVDAVIREGNERAREAAQQTMRMVRNAMKMDYIDR